jgi:hypothetical protein
VSIENKKHILNLVGELNSFLTEYFAENEFVLYERDKVEDIEVLDYIIVSSVEEADNVAKEYGSVKNEIEIICYENSSEVKEFLLSNGRLIINDKISNDALGNHILSKYFTKLASIHLEDSLPDQIETVQNFKLTNHLATGNSIDEISVNAFESGFNLVPIRSFVDHAIYYFTYLKQAGLAGIPFEFEYGHNQQFYAINIHASVKNFVAEYMIDSFGTVNSNDPLKYLLGVLARSCDFLDLTYIENPGKIVITGFFTQDNINGLKGIAFNNVFTSSQVVAQVEKKISNYVPQVEKAVALEQKQNELKDKRLPGGIMDTLSPVSENSILNDSQLMIDEIVNHMVSSFQNSSPEKSISDFDISDFNNLSPSFENQEFINKLLDEDKNHLIERIQKNNLIKAYDEEVNKVREEHKNDQGLMEELQSTMSDDLATKVTSHIGLDLLNNILGKDEFENSLGPDEAHIPEGENVLPPVSMFGEFTPSVPQNFEVGAAFDSIVPEFDNPNFDSTSIMDSLENDLSGDKLDPTFVAEPFEMPGFEDSTPVFEGDDFDDLFTAEIPDITFGDFEEPAVISGGEEEDAFSALLSGGESEDPFASLVSGGLDDEESISNIKGLKEEAESAFKIGGGPDDPDNPTMVKGGKDEADDFFQKISGMDKEKESDFITSFSSSFDTNAKDDKFSFSSSNSEERKKDLKLFVQNTLSENPGLESMDIKIKAFVNKEAPERINAGLELYADKLGQSLDSLTNEQIEGFKETELPNILTGLVSDDDKIESFKSDLEEFLNEDVTEVPMPDASIVAPQTQVSKFENSFKQKLEEKLALMENIAKEDDKFVVSKDNLPEEQMQTLIQETMKETFEEELKFSSASPEEISAKETQLIKDLSNTLQMDEDGVRAIVKGASDLAREKEKQFVAGKLYGEDDFDETTTFKADGVEEDNEYVQQTNSKAEAELISKLKKTEDENRKLKTSNSALQLQLSATDDVKEKFEQVVSQSVVEEDQVVVVSGISDPTLNAVEKIQVISDLKDGKPLSEETSEKLQRSLEKENKIIELAKMAETQLKKFQLESEKKDALFKAELSKAQKAVKGKDVVLQKAKDSLRNVMSKKEKEQLALKSQVNELNQKLKNDQSTKLKVQVKALNKEKDSLSKTAEVYKNKLESMAKSIDSNKKDDNSKVLVEENRNLKRLKTQLENKFNSESKGRTSAEDRLQKSKQAETKARSESTKAQTELKLVTGQIKTLKDQNTKLVQSAASSGNLSAGKISKELDQAKGKNAKLQEKISTLTKKLEGEAKTAAGASPENIEQISQNPTQAKAEIEKSAKEVGLLKDQNQKLQNKIEELNSKYTDTAVKSISPNIVSAGEASKEAVDEKKSKKENDLLKNQNIQLQDKIKELVGKLKKSDSAKSISPADAASAKEKRLEQSVKKMSMELTQARTEAADKKKEAMKGKSEISGLKNQLTKLKRDLEKAQKSASPGKGKKKAA